MEHLNDSLFLWINADAGVSAWQLQLATFIARDLIYVAPLILLALLLRPADRAVAIKTLLALLCGILLAKLLNYGLPRPRPFVVGIGRNFLPHAADPSFPSNHATFIFTFALSMLLWYRRWLGGVLLCVALSIAWSRVYLGVHFPLDMAGGLLVAMISVGLVHLGAHYWLKSKRTEVHLAP